MNGLNKGTSPFHFYNQATNLASISGVTGNRSDNEFLCVKFAVSCSSAINYCTAVFLFHFVKICQQSFQSCFLHSSLSDTIVLYDVDTYHKRLRGAT